MWIEVGKFVIGAGLGLGGTFCYILMIDRKRKKEQYTIWNEIVEKKRAKEEENEEVAVNK